MKWKTKDGQLLEVGEMETSHIENSLVMLKDKGFIATSTLNFYLTCSTPNGDKAVDCFEAEFEEIINAPISSFIDLFKAELVKRKG